MRREIKIAIAAKVEHAPKLAAIHKDGFHITSRWIWMAASGQESMKPVTHWQQENFDDIEMADFVILYLEPGDKLKGALIEIGYAVRAGKHVWIAGDGNGVEIPWRADQVAMVDNPDGPRRLPHRDIEPWSGYRQAFHIAKSLDAALDQIARFASPTLLKDVNTGTYPTEENRPSVLYRPAISLDGNQYCALYGEDLMAGCAGFGTTIEAAMRDFDKNWREQKAPQPAKA